MSGHHNINVGLNVQFNADNTGALKDLNSTLEAANKTQIEQNKQINELLKAIGQSTQGTTTEIVKETRATRDATASMNAWAGSLVQVKSLMYQNIGTFRNLGEMAIKSITSLNPYLKIADVFVQMTEKLSEFITRFKEFTALDKDFNPTIWEKLQPPKDMITDVDTFIDHFKEEFGLLDAVDLILPEERKNKLKKELTDMIETTKMAMPETARLASQLDADWRFFDEMQKQKLADEQGGWLKKLAKDSKEWKDVEGYVTRENIKGYLLQKEAAGELLSVEQEMLYIMRQAKIEAGKFEQPFSDAFLEKLREYMKLRKELDKGSGRGKKTKPEEYKNIYGDLSWFIEQWEESTLIKEKNWLTDLEKWRRDAYRRRDKDAKTQWEKQKSEWLIKETFINKYVENAKKQFEEVAKIQQGVQAKYGDYETKKGGAAYLESEAKKKAALLTRDYLDIDIKNITSEEKKKIQGMEKELTDALKRDSDQAWSTLQQKLSEYQKVFNEQDEVLKRPDLNQDQQYRAWTIQNEMRAKSQEAWKEYYDYLKERSDERAEDEKKLAEARAEAWSNQFKWIDKDKAYWKGTKKAMEGVIEATNELGVSEKIVHAISNTSKGLEASADAIECNATALKLYALHDIPGGIAMHAAALAKAAAAAAYFKNAIQLGGSGGSTPAIGTGQIVGSENRERNITINMAFEGTAGAIVGPLADAFNQQASVPGGVRLNSNLIRR